MTQPRIMIADYNPLMLQIAQSRLTDAGYEVLTARDGMEVLDQAHAWSPDLIMLDLIMPALDGFTTLKRLKAGPLGSIPVIIISALKDEADIARALNAGAADYLTKPFAPSELVERAATHLAPPAS